jgi:hypothetical protein
MSSEPAAAEDGDEGCEAPEDKGECLSPAEANCVGLLGVLLMTLGGIAYREGYEAPGFVRHFAAALSSLVLTHPLHSILPYLSRKALAVFGFILRCAPCCCVQTTARSAAVAPVAAVPTSTAVPTGTAEPAKAGTEGSGSG